LQSFIAIVHGMVGMGPYNPRVLLPRVETKKVRPHLVNYFSVGDETLQVYLSRYLSPIRKFSSP